MSFATLQEAVDSLRADNTTLTDELIAASALASQAQAEAEAAKVAAQTAETNAAQSETLADQHKAAAEATVPLAEQHKLDAEAQVPLAAAEKVAAEAARDAAVLTALGPDNDKLAAIASVYGQPSLNLDFAKQSFWKQGTYPWNQETLDPAVDLTFTRASTATYFDKDGVLQTAAADEMRFDHDPVTGEPLGVLIEESATNQYPDNISMPTVSGVSEAVVTREVGQASPITPDKGVRIVSTGGDDVRKWSTGTLGATTSQYRWSAWVTNNGNGSVRLYGVSGAVGVSEFVAPGETKRVFLLKSSTGNGNRGFGLEAETPTDDTDVTIVGAMLQQDPDSIPEDTSTIFTSGAPVTRAADSLRRPFAEEYNPKEGTWVWEGLWTPNQGRRFFARVITSNNMWGLGCRDGTTNSFYYAHRIGGPGPGTTANRLFIGGTLGTAPRRIVVAGAYKAGGAGEGFHRIAVGGRVQTSVREVPEIPVDSTLLQDTDINPGEVGSVRYYPYAMTEAELIELTALPEEPVA